MSTTSLARVFLAMSFGVSIGLLAIEESRSEQPTPRRVTLVVGSLFPEEGAAEPAEKSPLQSPFGVDFNSEGAMYIIELEGGRVHRRDADGKLQVIAGDGSRSYRGDGGPVRAATFNGMHNLAIAKSGKAYIADTWNHCVRQIDLASGKISTMAGSGEAGFSGDGGPAQDAAFHDIMCVSLTPAEDAIYLADLKNRRIRAIDLGKGTVRTVAGNGEKGVPRDGASAVESPLVDPRAVAVDSKGRVYILERGGHALRRVDEKGRIYTVAGTGKQGHRDGPALEAQFGSPKHLCVDDRDRVYIADDTNAAIRCYDPETSTVTTILGRGHGSPKIELKHPHGVCFEQGKLFVVDTGNNRIFVVELDG
jgi:sugar lactone lactonase YvrE